MSHAVTKSTVDKISLCCFFLDKFFQWQPPFLFMTSLIFTMIAMHVCFKLSEMGIESMGERVWLIRSNKVLYYSIQISLEGMSHLQKWLIKCQMRAMHCWNWLYIHTNHSLHSYQLKPKVLVKAVLYTESVIWFNLCLSACNFCTCVTFG